MDEIEFKANDGLLYTITISDDGDEIKVALDGTSLGYINLEYRCDPPIDQGHYYISYLALEECKRKGIGRACLEFHIELFGAPLLAAEEHGPKLEDGSHLIGDGISFIRKMRHEGIVCRKQEEEY